MSADNGVYIFLALDGCYVLHANAIENLTHQPDYKGVNKATAKQYMQNAAHYLEERFAWDDAKLTVESLPVCEYGILVDDITFRDIDVEHEILQWDDDRSWSI